MLTSVNEEDIIALKSRVTFVAMWVNVFLTLIKISVGIIGQSTALIADGIHSFSDLASDLLVLIALKLGAKEADYAHPYGHKRFETLATVILGLGLIGIAIGIAWDSTERLVHPETLTTPTMDTLGIAAISILANEWLYHYTKRISILTRSKLLLANAWHHRSDAISSVIVLLGIGAVLIGYPFADTAAAILVALMVGKIGVQLVLDSLKELVDTAVSEEMIQKIRRTIKTTQGVEGIHLLRTRQMGEDVYIDAHIVVNAKISVSEGHIISDRIRRSLTDQFNDIVDVLVHIDPEDDEFKENADSPLSRQTLTELMEKTLGDEIYTYVETINIHYLNEKIELEIVIPHRLIPHTEHITSLHQQCALLAKQHPLITKINLFLKV